MGGEVVQQPAGVAAAAVNMLSAQPTQCDVGSPASQQGTQQGGADTSSAMVKQQQQQQQQQVPTASERQAWHREVVRAVRLAVTAVRSVRMRVEDTIALGQRHMNEACNFLLQVHHLAPLRLGVWGQVPELRGVLKEASRTKLLRLASSALLAARGTVASLQALCEEAAVAADSLRPLMTLTWQASDSDALCPGFGAAQAAALLQQMVAGLLADAEDKAAVVATAAAQLRALQHAVSGASTIANAGNADRASSMAVDTPLPLEQLSARCQVWLSVWLLSPRRDTATEEAVVAALTEALTAAA